MLHLLGNSSGSCHYSVNIRFILITVTRKPFQALLYSEVGYQNRIKKKFFSFRKYGSSKLFSHDRNGDYCLLNFCIIFYLIFWKFEVSTIIGIKYESNGKFQAISKNHNRLNMVLEKGPNII